MGSPNCPLCRLDEPNASAWVVCFRTEPTGYWRHEVFSFGPGSPATDRQSETWARSWERTHRLASWPQSILGGIFRRGAVAAKA